jgi:hypothetical protein
LLLLAWAEAMLDEEALADARLAPLVTDAWPLLRVDALCVKGLLAARWQRWEDARAALAEAVTLSGDMPYPYAEAKSPYMYGQLHTAKHEPVQAREQYRAALSICERLGDAPPGES